MTYKLTHCKDRWIVVTPSGGYFSTPSLELAVNFIKNHVFFSEDNTRDRNDDPHLGD